MRNPLLDGLNQQQKKAVLHKDGPLLILAGAGTGKTKVITHRIAYLIKNHGIKPSHILALTFTNKAAAEMRERAERLIGEKVSSKLILPYLGTFHSICAKILRTEARNLSIPHSFVIYDEDDQISIIKEIMEKLKISPEEIEPRTIAAIISRAKDDLLTPSQFSYIANSDLYQVVNEVYPLYQKALEKRGALDFSDLLLKSVELFRNKNVLEKYQKKFEYILVDEYQDTNYAQYVIVNKLAQKKRNIAVCGDDDQNIYTWRGATIQNILSFEKDYPDATVIKLEQNYRSTKNILDAAYHVIKHNVERKDKRLWTKNPRGEKISIYTAADEQDEASFVVETTKKYLENGISPGEICILYRVNAQSRVIEEALIKENLPYKLVGGVRFYQRKEIKDILSYLRFIHNPCDTTSLLRIINVPPRGIGKTVINQLTEFSRLAKIEPGEIIKKISERNRKPIISAEKKLSKNEALISFSKLIEKIQIEAKEKNLKQMIEKVIRNTHYIKWIDNGTDEARQRIENIQELLSSADKYKELPLDSALTLFLTDVALLEKEQNEDTLDPGKITLMTLHSAKGLEFEVVFIIGCEEGLLPHRNSKEDIAEIEEERRLCYVGITRSKKYLYISYADSRMIFGSRQKSTPSRFLSEIPYKYIQSESSYFEEEQSRNHEIQKALSTLKVGDRIRHKQLGVGIVESIDDEMVYILFDRGGRKALMLEYAQIEKL